MPRQLTGGWPPERRIRLEEEGGGEVSKRRWWRRRRRKRKCLVPAYHEDSVASGAQLRLIGGGTDTCTFIGSTVCERESEPSHYGRASSRSLLTYDTEK